MSKDIILGLIRHVLTAGGGIVAAKGWGDSANIEILVGALVAIAGAIWSIVNKKNKAE